MICSGGVSPAELLGAGDRPTVVPLQIFFGVIKCIGVNYVVDSPGLSSSDVRNFGKMGRTEVLG